MTAGLHLAEDLTLPLDAVTETFAILGQRGSGKTSTAVVMAEEMIAAGLPVVIIDPLGVWWGLRSNAAGDGDGLPVVIFGGDHADLPLSEDMPHLLADIIVDRRPPAVLDLSHLSKSAGRRFVTVFLERLYERNRDPLHLVLDEVDLWAPQRTQAEGARCLGAVQDVVRRGRQRGLGTSLITQRSAVLNKDVLGQASVLITLRMTGVRDVAAIDEWVNLHATDQEAREVKASLPSLPVGTAWVWSPGWLDLLQRTKIRPRSTFDSSATPKVGERRIMPERLVPVDLAALRELLATDDEPDTPGDAGSTALRRRVADLERQLAEAKHRPPVEVPVLSAGEAEQLQELASSVTDGIRQLLAGLDRVHARLPQREPSTATPRRETPAAESPIADPDSNGQLPGLRKGARVMLSVLAEHHPSELTRAQLATLSRLKVTGGTFTSYYSALRKHGLIEEHDGLTSLTEAGVCTTDVTARRPSTTEMVLARWRDVLRAGARSMLDELVSTYPAGWSRADLAAAVNLEPKAGTFTSYLSMLRRNGLIDVAGDKVTASRTLFLGTERNSDE